MSEKLGILLLEDVDSDAELVEHTLRKAKLTFSLERVETKEAFVKGLDEFRPHIILADYRLPSFDGLSALGISQEKCPDVPFIFVSGSIGEEFAIETLRRGATDYILKDRLSRLAPAVRRALAEAEEHIKRQKAEEDLRQSQAEYEDLYESAPAAYFSVGTDGFVRRANRAAANLSGYSVEELQRLKIFDLYAEESRVKAKELLERMKRGIGWESEEMIYKTKKGQKVHGLLSVSPIKDGNGRVKESRSVVVDITQRKKAEEKLKQYQEHLEELVEERTIKLEKEILERKKAEGLIREQNERLKELDRMKSEFLSTAAHELRTPLTSILGFSEILLKRKLDEERKNRFLKIINEESMGLSALINDLLDLSRIESGKGFKITKAPIDIKEVILENVDVFEHQTDKHTFKVNIPDDLVKIEADKDKISQVIENLISNALKFSPQGGDITVSIEQSKAKTKINVSDNGIGIPEKDLSHIFEKFYRAENASSEAIGGTGLGLAIVKYIVEHHGGIISVESGLGRGTTFSFTLSTKSTKTRRGRRVS